LLNLLSWSFQKGSLVTRIPAVNIKEQEKAFSIELAAPGLAKSDFKINVDKNIISVSVDKVKEQEVEGLVYSKKEYNYSSFSRSFTLPETVDYSNIDASYVDGILTVKIGKKEDAIIAKRLIEVK